MVFPRSKEAKAGAKGGKEAKVDDLAPAFLPERRSVYVRTFGCAHNQSDSEYMAGLLSAEGYVVSVDADDADAADAWLINSCTVKDPSQAAFARVVNEGLAQGKAVVVAGCVPQAQRSMVKDQPEWAKVSMVGVKQLGRVGEAVEASLRGESLSALGCGTGLPSLELPKVRRNDLVEVIPLSSGCLGACTYCKTRHARGKLGSYPLEAIEHRVLGALEDGVAEIWLSSEDTGAYGIDLGTSLGALLDRIVPHLSASRQGAMLRVGMTNPPFILDQLDAVARALNAPSVYAFMHVPVQSGSDRILGKDRMNREYDRNGFESVCDGLAERVSTHVTVATDLICGFPGETDADFDATMTLVQKYRFGTCNISQFYARPGTPAAAMRPRVPTAVVKQRSRALSILVNGLEPYVGLVGTVVECHACADFADGGIRLVAHTKNYTKVLVAFDRRLCGASFRVRVLKAHRWHVDAELITVIRQADAENRPALRAALQAMDKELAKLEAKKVPARREAAPAQTAPAQTAPAQTGWQAGGRHAVAAGGAVVVLACLAQLAWTSDAAAMLFGGLEIVS
ncbi:hypothetical protein M885DRAFT_436910 [Pelagophyceae sp. CCMP2097]|nr:hypothetical protein M885DRAFT_436910 [Pelagophyceae sp. CCMP2097]